MYPELVRVGAVAVGTHDVLVAVALVVASAVFAAEVRRRGVRDDRLWYVIAGVLLGGVLLGRLGTWLQHLDLRRNASVVEQWAYGNRSILSALVGAYIGALVAKRLCGYTERTGHLFAPAVAAGMAVGRVGCLLTELPGTPTGGSWGITLSPAQAAGLPGAPAGVPLHPSFAYEIAFHLAALAALAWLRGRLPAPADAFTLYLAGYAAFRFAVEFVRGNEVVAAGLTRPQWFLLACAPLFGWRLVTLARNGTFRLRRREEVPA
ncbi:MAG TPA: prolipoprotein diacylglyceryl transferase family protein [Pilimelia sp.]|nr:prolipoprotein diacylglyceryl transferase family protein [Pilimelia sp.]